MGTDDNGYESGACRPSWQAKRQNSVPAPVFQPIYPQIWGYLCLDFEDDRNLGAVAVGEFGRVRLDPVAAIRAPHDQPHARRGRATKRHRRPGGKTHPRRPSVHPQPAPRGVDLPALTSEAARR